MTGQLLITSSVGNKSWFPDFRLFVAPFYFCNFKVLLKNTVFHPIKSNNLIFKFSQSRNASYFFLNSDWALYEKKLQVLSSISSFSLIISQDKLWTWLKCWAEWHGNVHFHPSSINAARAEYYFRPWLGPYSENLKNVKNWKKLYFQHTGLYSMSPTSFFPKYLREIFHYKNNHLRSKQLKLIRL